MRQARDTFYKYMHCTLELSIDQDNRYYLVKTILCPDSKNTNAASLCPLSEMRPPVRSGRPVRRYNEDDKESTTEGSSMIFTCKVCGQEYKKELSWIKHMHQSHKDEPGLQLPGKAWD